LGTADPKGPTFTIVAGALGSIGHRQAQEALIAAIQARPADWPALANLIPTLGAMPSPILAAEDAVRELATSATDSNISTTAWLALGSMANNLSHRSASRSATLVDQLLRRARATKSDDEAQIAIEALGNAASIRSLPFLSQFSLNSSKRLRAAAFDALRSIHSPQADAILLRGLGDADGETRLEAAYALGFRKISAQSFAAQKKALLADSNDKVRAALLNNLWKARGVFHDGSELVSHAAESDASEYVRKVAKGLLLERP
jgi:HEAT repeat protein